MAGHGRYLSSAETRKIVHGEPMLRGKGALAAVNRKPVYELDPLCDGRWIRFIDSHRHSSVFHRPEWLEALKRTYKYKPIALTTTAPGVELADAIVFCQVDSYLTGSKRVSLPFSDHCEPLADPTLVTSMLADLSGHSSGKLRFIQIRPRFDGLRPPSNWVTDSHYCLHTLDLSPDSQKLHASLHKDSIQRKIRRADREGVALENGRSEVMLRHFYNLMLMTRRRHRVPPQPLSWFRNLVVCFGDRLSIRVAYLDKRPIASILTLRHRKTLVYKYGCSDERFHKLGGMPRLFWQAIEDAKAEGLLEFDLGRSDLDNEGLVRFKDHLGAARTGITYWQWGNDPAFAGNGLRSLLKAPLVQATLSRLPEPLFRLAGEVLYRHAG